MVKKPVTIYVLLFTYSILLYGGIRGIGGLIGNNPDYLWAGSIVLLSVLAGIVSLFFKKKWPYVYNIILLSLILAFQTPLFISNIASGKVRTAALLIMGAIMTAFALLLVFFIRNTKEYFLGNGKRPAEQEIAPDGK